MSPVPQHFPSRVLRFYSIFVVARHLSDALSLLQIWSLNASSLLATLHHFGVSSSISLISTAHLAYDVSEYVPPVEKDSDEESDNDKMNVEDAKQTHKKKRKVKKPRSVESFPERNLQGFLELMTVLIETKSLSITEAQKLVFLSILIRFSTDPLIFGGEHAQGPLVTCMSTLVDDLVSSPGTSASYSASVAQRWTMMSSYFSVLLMASQDV